MSLNSDVLKLSGLSPATAAVILDAAAALLTARLAVAVLPFRAVARGFGLSPTRLHEAEVHGDHAGEPHKLSIIRWSIAATAARLPWESSCLVRALAAALMLRRRRLPAALFLGVAKEEGNKDKFAAHAWLISGGACLTGDAGRTDYSPIAVFETAGA